MKLFGAGVMRELDRYTIEEVGIPGIVLMELAGRGAADHIEVMARERGLGSALVVAGPGNNGGDGFVVARHLADRGLAVAVVLLTQAAAVKGDAAATFAMLRRFPVRVIEAPGGAPEEMSEALPGAGPDLVIDAIFGTGLARPVEGVFADAVDAINALPCPRVALDIPTGVDADTGRILGRAVRADLTVTFGAAKIGHWSYPGRAMRGRLEVVPIGIPRAAIDRASGAVLVGREEAAVAFPPRDPEGFKNRYGHVVVVGGVPGKAGAALLAANGAVRAGAGLVTIATHPESAARVEGRFPELMVEAAIGGEGPAGALPLVLGGKSAVVAGPGLGTDPFATRAVEQVLACGLPAVLDADALNVIAARPETLAGLRADAVMTPHPGEAGRLLGRSTTEVQADRVSAVRELAARAGAVVVLKGAGTLIAAPDGRLAVNPTGSPALATAGSGDVLAGVIGALLARGVAAFEAACAACWVHGVAGEVAARRLGEHSVGAPDVVEALAAAIALTTDSPRDGGR